MINPANPATAATPATITRSTEAPPVNEAVALVEVDFVVELLEVVVTTPAELDVTTLEELIVDQAPQDEAADEEAADDEAEEQADEVELAP
jgi:hypothetical protein